MRPNNNTKARKQKGQPIYSEKDHKVIAYVFGDELHKHLRKIMYNPPAIATDIEALRKGQQAGAKVCVVTNKTNGLIYKAPIEKIWEKGWVVNFGYGDQQALTLENWLQTRTPDDPDDFQTQTQPPDYSDPSGTNSVMPLHYESHAPVGVKYEKGSKQMGLWGDE